tara:strand:+ start:585 stop:1241 length:657 start_codon:yes stop_codon:yes gene_type:complete
MFKKKISLAYFISIIILYQSSSYAGTWGKGELKFSTSTMNHFMRYLYGAADPKSGFAHKKNKPSFFIAAKNGDWSYYSYCPYAKCVDPNLPKLIKLCEKGSRGSPCKVFALERRIVWKNGGEKVRIKKSMLKDPISIALKIKQAGFYDGDIYQLLEINTSTGQNIDNEKIKPKNSDKKTVKISNSDDFVEKLKELKKLFDEGAISEKEFKKAKAKLLD